MSHISISGRLSMKEIAEQQPPKRTKIQAKWISEEEIPFHIPVPSLRVTLSLSASTVAVSCGVWVA